jgi:regulator of protease activity HflC (stomatin/prohibitin superfamily)
MERNTQKHGLINLLSLLAAGVAGLAIARYGNSLAGQVGVLFLGLGTVVALVSWFQLRLEETERLEGLELDEMAKSRGESTLFENKDAELFPARRAREQYERFFVPIVTVLLALAQGGGAYLIWRWLQRPATVETQLRQPTMVLAMFALFALVLFLLGKFSTTVARLDDQRLLRPGSSYALLGAYICFAVTLGIVAVQSGFAKADYYVAYGLCVILGLVAVETVIQLVLEIYRPRVKGKVERPLYESRLVGLLGQPEGLITTAAQALDYQFGFKVSETWFYRFFERALGWILLLQVGALVLSTCFVFVEAGEQGLLEHFGRPVEGKALLEPGVHAKWPWPIDKVRIYRTEQIQEFIVGSEPDPAREQDRIVLWTVSHAKEENFLVAHREANTAAANTQQGGKRTPPVSLLTVSIPVQYQITNLLAWAYNNEDANSLLNHAATREVVRFLVGADLNHIMSDGRLESSEELVRRVQNAADRLKLGARIISVGLHDLHPPVKVAPDYEKVVGSIQTRQAKILAAQADAIRTNAMAEAESSTITNLATADRVAQEIGALSRAALFTNQIPAFEAAPSVYVQRAYLRAFVNATAGARKYINLATNTDDVLVIDLQDKIREDLLNTLNVPAPKN